jgi:hypothetical protein
VIACASDASQRRTVVFADQCGVNSIATRWAWPEQVVLVARCPLGRSPLAVRHLEVVRLSKQKLDFVRSFSPRIATGKNVFEILDVDERHSSRHRPVCHTAGHAIEATDSPHTKDVKSHLTEEKCRPRAAYPRLWSSLCTHHSPPHIKESL